MDELRMRQSDRIEYLGAGASDRRLFDLSTTGAGFYYEKPKAKDAVVALSMNDLKLKARVVHCTKRDDVYRYGVQFVDVAAEAQKKLDALVDGYSKGVPVNCTVLD